MWTIKMKLTFEEIKNHFLRGDKVTWLGLIYVFDGHFVYLDGNSGYEKKPEVQLNNICFEILKSKQRILVNSQCSELLPTEMIEAMKRGRLGMTRNGGKVKFGFMSECDTFEPFYGDIIHHNGFKHTVILKADLRCVECDSGDIIDLWPLGTEFK